MCSNSIYVILLLLVLGTEATNFRENCRAVLNRGRTVIENHVPAIVHEEMARVRRKIDQRMDEMFKAELIHASLGLGKYMAQPDGGDTTPTTPPPCPAPNRTMFTTPAPPITTTQGTPFCTTLGTSRTDQTAAPVSTVAGQTLTAATVTSTTTSTNTDAAQTPSLAASPSTASAQTAPPTTTLTGAAVGADDVTTATSSSPSQQTTSSGATASSMASSGSSASPLSSNQTMPSSTVTSQSSTTSSCIPVQQSQEFSKSFTVPTMFTANTESDPFHNWISSLYDYMFKTEEICDHVQITDLNSITEDQLYGFLATLSTAHPGPFCSLCDHLVSEMVPRVFSMHPLWEEDEQHLMRLLYANIPSAKAFCSTLAPACYENYEDRTRNITEALVCLECTACMTLGNVIQHSFLLDKKMVEAFLQFLRSSLFHNTCAELCLVWQPLNLTLFPNGFTYDGCMNFMTDSYRTVIDVATVILRPERFCALELHWCELNETPNLLHCLRELCLESLSDTPQARWLCSQIPDTPNMADQFLNVHQTKRYKTRRPYHDKYERGSTLRDEL